MTRIKLRGMTRGHRRAIDPLLAVQAQIEQRHPGIEIEWSSRSLSGIEYAPLPEQARQIDAAGQVAVARPDLMAMLGETAPGNWRALLELGAKAESRGLKLAICL